MARSSVELVTVQKSSTERLLLEENSNEKKAGRKDSSVSVCYRVITIARLLRVQHGLLCTTALSYVWTSIRRR